MNYRTDIQSMIDEEKKRNQFYAKEQQRGQAMRNAEQEFQNGRRVLEDADEIEEIVKNGGTVEALCGNAIQTITFEDGKFTVRRDGEIQEQYRRVDMLDDFGYMKSHGIVQR